MDFNPVVISYAVVTLDNVFLFVDPTDVTSSVHEHFAKAESQAKPSPKELEGIRQAHIRDGADLTLESLSEVDAMDKLEELRGQVKDQRDLLSTDRHCRMRTEWGHCPLPRGEQRS